MGKSGYVLGIDCSTQSTTAVVLDSSTFQTIIETRVRYRDDPRLAAYGLTSRKPILPPLEIGEASQPAMLFIDALEAVLSDIPQDILERIDAINISAQQHGQVWVSNNGSTLIAELAHEDLCTSSLRLSDILRHGIAYERAPIWMSANSQAAADEIRMIIGGQDRIVELSGSDSLARFTGPVLARTAQLFAANYENTARIHLISSFLAGVLSANPDAPIDWGNGSGTGMMDWKNCIWNLDLISATAQAGKLPQGTLGLKSRLPSLAHPLSQIGKIAGYFRKKYGFSENCTIIASSGDNPQSKVLSSGPLLSLGTSFVIMGEGKEPIPSANAMYDGLGRPFLFGCRTNGSLVWDNIRAQYGLADDFSRSEKALASVKPGSVLRILQTSAESFPLSSPIDIGSTREFYTDYAGVVDSALGLVALASKSFMNSPEPIAATGGAAASKGILARAASIWDKPIIPIANAGAATGAAVAAACAIVPESEREEVAEYARSVATKPGQPIEPQTAAVRAYHSKGGYLEQLAEKFAEITGKSH